jgi:hypothetical protein
MRLKLPVSAAVAILVVSGATASWAGKGSGRGKKSTEAVVPESVNRQFQWEEKVVGPKNQGVDHNKIAAMQEQARREDAAKKKLPPPQKQSRTDGVSAPASATPPTMDIEKPAPAGSVRKPATVAKKPAQEWHRRDALDNLLAEEGAKPPPASSSRSSNGGLGSILAVDDTRKQPAAAPRGPAKKPAPHKHRRR